MFYAALLASILAFVMVVTGGLATTATSLANPESVLFHSLSHRHAGEFAGAAMLALFAWITFGSVRLRKLGGALCVGVILQGVLGAMPVAGSLGPMLHSCLAQVLLAGSIALVLALSVAWTSEPQKIQDYGWPSLRSLSITLPVLIGIQVALGAAFRHRLLGLMPHVIGAMLVAMFILVVGSFVLQQCKDHKLLAGAGRTMIVVTFVQVFLGLAVFTVRSMPQQDAGVILAIATAHVVTGGALLGASVVLGMIIRRNVVPKA